MNNPKRTHRLTMKNSVSDFKTIGYILTDSETANIISGLIEAQKLSIVLDDGMDINALMRLQYQSKEGKVYMNNFPMIFPMDRQQKPAMVQQQPVIQAKATTEEEPF